MVVHEWGTFTSLQDEGGNAIGGINTDDEPVPNFVHRAQGGVLAWPTELPPVFFGINGRGFSGKGLPGLHGDVTMRLETPVMYFYPPPGSTLPIEMDVRAGFKGGWLLEFYPKAAMEASGLQVEMQDGSWRTGGIDRHTRGTLSWNRLQIGVEGNGPFTSEEVWLAPRRVAAAMVGTEEGQQEKYLFYRGVGHLDALLRVYRSDDGQRLEIRQQPFSDPDAPATGTIGNAWLAHIRHDGTAAYLSIGSLNASGGSAAAIATIPAHFSDAEFSTDNLDRLRAEMHEGLVAEGLFDDEATAMLDTWKEAYFHSPGLRFFFTVPQAWTDHYLPLEFSEPVDLTRVMVGRIEVVTPEQRELLARIATRPVEPFPTSGLRALFAEDSGQWRDSPTYKRLRQGKMSLRALDFELPRSYVDFLELGRLRHALLLDELRRRPTNNLRDFVDNYRFQPYRVPITEQVEGTMRFPADQPILDDELATAWRVECDKGAEVLGLTTSEPVFSGRSATVVRTRPEKDASWSMTLVPPQEVMRLGLAGVRLALHPGDTDAENADLKLVLDESSVDLARGDESFRIELDRRDWQVLEVPFDAFGRGFSGEETISTIRLEGNTRGTFYLDDVRLVGNVPSGLANADVATAVEAGNEEVPVDFALEQNYPNPFNSETILRFGLPLPAEVTLRIYNLAGQEVATPSKEFLDAGVHAVRWDGRNGSGNAVATGVYVYRLETPGRTLSRKLLLLR